MENEWKLLKQILNELESIDSLNGGGGTPVDLSGYVTTQYFNNSLNSFSQQMQGMVDSKLNALRINSRFEYIENNYTSNYTFNGNISRIDKSLSELKVGSGLNIPFINSSLKDEDPSTILNAMGISSCCVDKEDILYVKATYRNDDGEEKGSRIYNLELNKMYDVGDTRLL